jgi:hypothetical protein
MNWAEITPSPINALKPIDPTPLTRPRLLRVLIDEQPIDAAASQRTSMMVGLVTAMKISSVRQRRGKNSFELHDFISRCEINHEDFLN